MVFVQFKKQVSMHDNNEKLSISYEAITRKTKTTRTRKIVIEKYDDKHQLIMNPEPFNPFSGRKIIKGKPAWNKLLALNIINKKGEIIKSLEEIQELEEQYFAKETKPKHLKEDEIVNPLNNRTIKRDSKKHKELIKENILDEEGNVIGTNKKIEKSKFDEAQYKNLAAFKKVIAKLLDPELYDVKQNADILKLTLDSEILEAEKSLKALSLNRD